MTVVSIKFKGRGKTYFFDPNGLEVPEGAQVVVETSKGLELGECVEGCHEVPEEGVVQPLKSSHTALSWTTSMRGMMLRSG